MIKAVILAGGRGSRLGNIIANIPKSMVHIAGKPLLEYQVKWLKKNGVNEIIFLTHYLADVIEEYFGNGNSFGIQIKYHKEIDPLGTTGGIKEIESILDKDFLLLYGDVMVNIDLTKLLSFHFRKKSTATLVIHPTNHLMDSDLVEVNESNRIIQFHPKPHNQNKYYQNLTNAGLYILSPKIFNFIKKGQKQDFGKDLFPAIVNSTCLYGYRTFEYIKDMGTYNRLQEVSNEFSKGKVGKFNFRAKQKAIFLDRDGVINKTVDQLCKIEDFELLPNAGKAIKKINDSFYHSIVITNQSVIARNLCMVEDLSKIHKKMEYLLSLENAKLDAIYYCPHHPDDGYPEENKLYKIECECRKPKIGMILKAQEEFNLDLKKTWIIGDSEVDITAGINAGINTIYIGNKDELINKELRVIYCCGDIYDAVQYILEREEDDY